MSEAAALGSRPSTLAPEPSAASGRPDAALDSQNAAAERREPTAGRDPAPRLAERTEQRVDVRPVRRSSERATPAPVRRRRPGLATVAAFGAAALGVVQFYRPPQRPLAQPFAEVTRAVLPPVATPSPDALGRSGEVRLQAVLPRATVQFPLQVLGSVDSLAYLWVRASDTAAVTVPEPLVGAEVVAPDQPGLYRLALVRKGHRRVVEGMTLAVLVPFSQKLGTTLDGYRIGSYLAERIRGHERPDGFLKLTPKDLEIPVSRHFRLADFVARPGQRDFPRYAALSPALLDKLELVLEELGGGGHTVELDVHVNSGFRPPAYNRTVRRAARDSRHQYGDAADVRIDADRDGRFTHRDLRLVEAAVNRVEERYPDLQGGLGLYTSSDYRTPYAHIDARGTRARWRG